MPCVNWQVGYSHYVSCRTRADFYVVLNRICQHRNGDAIEPKDKELLDMFSMRRTGYSEDAFKKF